MKSSETWRIKALKHFCHKQNPECKERSKEEKSKEENRGQQLQSSFALLEHFPKSIFYMLYTISKLRKSRIQCFKRCAIRSWNEGVTAIVSRSLQAEGRFLHGCEISLLLREFRSHFEQCTGVLLKLPDSCDRHFWIFFFRYFCINFHFLLVFSHSCNSLARKYPRKGKLPSYINSLVNTEKSSFGELSPGDQLM